jgi:septal ring factor EnvC (AmiA/AmiB activator)
MKLRTYVIVAGLIACAAATAGAQAPAAPAVHELAPVIVTASNSGTLYRIAHMDEQRRRVLELVDQNRRLTADLRRADTRVAELEGRLVEAKADRDRRVADIAAVDSAAADTRRTRLELEAKLKRLEAGPTAPRDDNSPR